MTDPLVPQSSRARILELEACLREEHKSCDLREHRLRELEIENGALLAMLNESSEDREHLAHERDRLRAALEDCQHFFLQMKQQALGPLFGMANYQHRAEELYDGLSAALAEGSVD